MGSGLGAVELVPHPESNVKPLILEEIFAGLYRHGTVLGYEFVHVDKYVRLFLVGPTEILRQLKKSLKAVYGKVIIEEAEPPSLRGMLPAECFVTDGKGRVRLRSCGWWIAELKLSRPFWDVLLTHSRDSLVELNHINTISGQCEEGG